MSGHPEHLGLEISTMPSNEKEEAKISCKCGVCELTLADGKSTVSFLCSCEDCRQTLQWGFKNGGVKPDSLPRGYYNYLLEGSVRKGGNRVRWVSAHVLERQHGDRRLVGQSEDREGCDGRRR